MEKEEKLAKQKKAKKKNANKVSLAQRKCRIQTLTTLAQELHLELVIAMLTESAQKRIRFEGKLAKRSGMDGGKPPKARMFLLVVTPPFNKEVCICHRLRICIVCAARDSMRLVLVVPVKTQN